MEGVSVEEGSNKKKKKNNTKETKTESGTKMRKRENRTPRHKRCCRLLSPPFLLVPISASTTPVWSRPRVYSTTTHKEKRTTQRNSPHSKPVVKLRSAVPIQPFSETDKVPPMVCMAHHILLPQASSIKKRAPPRLKKVSSSPLSPPPPL